MIKKKTAQNRPPCTTCVHCIDEMANRRRRKVLSDKSDDRPLRYRLRTRARLNVFSGFSTAFLLNRQQIFGAPKFSTSRLRLNIDKEEYY